MGHNFLKLYSEKYFMVSVGILMILYYMVVSSNRDLIEVSTVGILILTLVIYSGQLHINVQANKTLLRTKQFEELYMPLKSEAPEFENLNIKEIEKYSYLASTELSKYIDEFIECIKASDTFSLHEKNKLYENVEDAIEKDIGLLKNDLGYL